MKVTKANTPPVFTPVVITLETQAEVNALFACFCHRSFSKIALDDAFGTLAWEKLDPFVTAEYQPRLSLIDSFKPEKYPQ